MVDFRDLWTGKKEGFADSMKRGLKPQRNIRPKIDSAIKLLNKQINKLDASIRNLKQKDQIYFAKVVQAIKDHDKTMATLYANELVEIRKAIRTLKQAKYALQSVVVRLQTVQNISDAAAEVLPAMQVLKNVRSMISVIIPTVDEGFAQINDVFENLIWEASQSSDTTTSIATASDEALKIIHEAEKKAKEEMRRELPGIPEAVAESEEGYGESGEYGGFRF